MLAFKPLIAGLVKQYGAPHAPHPHGLFELVMWENACYLLTDERRLEVFEGLRSKVGMSAAAIAAASDAVLMPLAERGGMRPETRVFRWREIARIVLTEFGGDLDSILQKPYAEAKRALKKFPNVGDPGAEKILLFCGVASGLPLESNGLRVLTRVGYGRAQKDYGKAYKSVQEDLRGELPIAASSLQAAHTLLRTHGKELCRDNGPLCARCPVAKRCDYAAKMAASFAG
jgi:endonuclease-3